MKPYATAENVKSKARAWLDQIRPYNQHEMRLNVAASALIVVDMQRFFLDPASPSFTCGGLAILPTVKRVIDAYRQANRPVIFTQHVHHPGNLDCGIMGWWWEGRCLEGSPESEVHPDLGRVPGEKVVVKHRYSAFYNTDLETVLRCLRVEDVVVSGIMTNMCCESTARDAYYRDYRVFFLADGTGSISEEMHLASLLNLAFGFAYVTTSDAIVDQLKLGSSPDNTIQPATLRAAADAERQVPHMVRTRTPDLIAGGLALMAGLGIGYVDSRATWDDTGITVGAIILSAALIAFVRPRSWWLAGILVALPVSVFNYLYTGNLQAAIALLFALAGAGFGGLVGKALGLRPRSAR